MNRRVIVAGVATCAVLVTGGVAFAQTGAAGYRTATVEQADVESTLSLSGTVAAASRRDLTFGSDGTVSKVSVKVGDTVEAGDTIAAIDPDDLGDAVTRAEADVAEAKAKLESDQSSQSSTVASAASAAETTSSSASRSSTPSTGSAAASGTSPAVAKALASLTKQQKAVTDGQTASTDAITTSKEALSTQQTACAVDDSEDEGGGDGDTPEPTPTETTETPAPAETAEPEVEASSTDECTAALSAVQDAQDAVATAQDDFQAALAALAKTLTDAVAALQSGTSTGGSQPSGSSGGASAPSSSSGASSASGGSSGSGGGGGQSVTAGTLAQDQAAIDTAEAALVEAELARDNATLTAPFDGTIVDLAVEKGDEVGSSDTVAIILGDDGSTITTSVTVDQVPEVEKGQVAHVLAAGSDDYVDGTVTAIGLLPTTDDSGSSTYPVTIALDEDLSAREGAGASVEIVTATAEDAITVPTSAVTRVGDRATVTVLTDGEPTPTVVTVDVVGATRTSITEGLEVGQEVVIAALDTALPSGDSSSTGGLGGGGFGGTGGGPRTMQRAG